MKYLLMMIFEKVIGRKKRNADFFKMIKIYYDHNKSSPS